MQKPQQALGHGHGVVLGGAAVAPPGPPPRVRGSAAGASPAPSSSEAIDPSSVSVSSAAAASSGLPFGSMPAWPQAHPLLQHQGQPAVDGQLQSHLYLQHALHLAQRAIQQQQQQGGKVAAPGANNMKLQEFMQLQSAMAAAQSDRDRALQQLQRNDASANKVPPQQPGSQTSPQGRVPSSMAFLFGQNPVGSSPIPSRPMEANPRAPPQQFMSPEMLQARMLAMQQQQQQQKVSASASVSGESPHLRLGTPQMMSAGSSSDQEPPPPPPPSSNLAGFGHGSDLLPNLRGGFQQQQQQQHHQQQQQQQHHQQQQQQLSSNLGTGLTKPDMNSNPSAAGFPMLSRQQQQQQQHQQHQQQQHQFGSRNMLENQNQAPVAPPPSQQQTGSSASSSAAAAAAPTPDPSSQPRAVGFTIQQLMVLRAQILAFRRLKRGDRSFTTEMIRAITPVPLPVSPPKQSMVPSETNQPKITLDTPEEKQLHRDSPKTQDTAPDPVPGSKPASMQQLPTSEAARAAQEAAPPGRAVTEEEKPVDPNETAVTDLAQTGSRQPAKIQPSKRYRGPLFDLPKPEASLLPMPTPSSWGPPATLKYDVRELLLQEGLRILSKKKAKKLKIIEMLLSDGSLNVPSELKLKLRIEQRKLVLLKMQGKVRGEIEEQQQEIMAMGDRAYRKFVRLCERQRMEISRQVMVLQKTSKEKHLKGIFQWRKKLLESHWSARDGRINRNRGVAKFHEKMLREYSKRRDEDRSKRMEALKNNDVDAYREMLKKQQKDIPGEQRFEVLESFLSQTEDYLHKLGGKISSVKNQQEREEAALAAAASARAQGFTEEEVERAAAQASEAIALRSWNGATAHSVNKYYSLAHAVNEQILRQPSMLRAGVLRDYQLVGLQWMLSLYNNRLNGILADEMGLGKTVQVMALIAYLMEFKGNYGPHLIIVPNAVMVNWKSELLRWLPSVSCIFYVGVREDRSRMYSQEVAALKFNVLVTTYEFIMRDRSKLAKIDWKYIIIDEAQRMKDRESRLARDLDRFRCQRRLLLTGTPLQNDLHELWSLLNLLLPEVFDNSKAFHDWFSKPFQRDAINPVEDDWLETEKKVIVIHRLHQILEPFMLRRRVEDVEGSLPPKVPVVLKCKMSAYQAAIYDWVKATGTIRLDPADEEERVAGGNGKRQARAFAPLQNKCMELRKVCNHPYLNYPPQCRVFNENMVRMCGKLWILDRILIKLQRTGHRVLLFSTMTKLLDILEDYLQWRGLIYRRIDGTTPLDSRETAIVDFNAPGSQCFIFLLSIRAAGRGLNLQTADTVVIYDPDPNPKNEEQAVARAHRIGQKSEVKVLYMEAVVETFTSYQMEDELRNGGSLDVDDEMAGKDRYIGSVESLVRNNIQQHKIDMADEVINAGRFDQRTTHEERRMTLEALLHDEERYQESVHDVPTLKEVNRMIARSEDEVELFDQMDDEFDWPGEMVAYDEVPEWLHVGSDEVNAAVKATSKQAQARGFSGISGIIGTKAEEDRVMAKKALTKKSLVKPVKPARRGRPPLVRPVEAEAEAEAEDDDDLEEAIIEEESSSGEDEEEGEIRDGSDEEDDDPARQQQDDVDDLDDDGEAVAESSDEREGTPETRVEVQLADSKKFGSLAELGSRDLDGEDLEEGEIAASGDSPGESPSEKEQDEDQIVEPKRKRKRSARHRRKNTTVAGNIPVQGVYPVGFLQPWSGCSEYESPEVWNITPRPAAQFIHSGFANWSSQAATKQIRVNGFQELAEEVAEMRESRTARTGARMQENVQKKCKAVLSKLQGAMNKDGRQVSALLMELPKRHELPEYYRVIDKPIDAKTIEEHLERFDYATVLDFAGDVQLMLDNASRYNTLNAEVQADARRLHSLFFQRMGLMFPDVDFNSIKVNIGIRLSGSRSSRKHRQVFPEAGKLTQQDREEPEATITGTRSSSKEHRIRRTKPGVVDTGEHGVIHPADLLIFKKKRNSRRKPRIKASNKRKRGGLGQQQQHNVVVEQGSSYGRDGRRDGSAKGGAKSMLDEGGPLSWARARKVYSALVSSSPSSPSVGGNRDAGNDGTTIYHPRKKSRTDTARRRPSTRL